MNLVGETSVVAKAIDDERQIDSEGVADRLAIVECFQRRRLTGIVSSLDVCAALARGETI